MPRWSRLFMVALAAVVAGLALPAVAGAKEVVSVTVCGATACNTVRPGDDDAPRDLTILAEGQAETSPPEQASGYFRVRMTAEADDERHSWTQAWVPADAVVRFRDDEREGGYVWLTLSEQTQAALERASAGLRPIAGSKLRGLDVKPPSVTVHKVVLPPAEAVAPSSGGIDDSVPEAILALVGAGIVAGIATFALLGVRRRRRARPPQAAPAR